MMAQYPDVFIMTFSIHIPNVVLLSQTAQLLLIFCYAAPLYVHIWLLKYSFRLKGVLEKPELLSTSTTNHGNMI